MLLIEEYITKSKGERQSHLCLNEPCIERGGQSMYLKGLLAHLMNTTIPSGKKIHVCHACHNDKCSNPNHIYWGTASENRLDYSEYAKQHCLPVSIWDRTVAKHGKEKAREIFTRSREVASKNGKGNLGKPKSAEHIAKISKASKDSWSKRKIASMAKLVDAPDLESDG